MEIRLTEGGEALVVDLADDVGDALSRSNVISATRLGGGSWLLAPMTKVGVAVVGGVTLWIRPKVVIRRILYLLGFAQKAGWHTDNVDLAEVEDLVPALAAAFCTQVERALEVGLLQGYQQVDDSLT